MKYIRDKNGLNPLNQVYVFNGAMHLPKDMHKRKCLNPLNQVYVFNALVK